jgi:hypothetical protein
MRGEHGNRTKQNEGLGNVPEMSCVTLARFFCKR